MYKLIDEILWNDWDPIGVNSDVLFQGEYEFYTPSIFYLKSIGMDKETIAQKLYEIETTMMGLTYDQVARLECCRQVAEKIINLK